jgi:hypothetical protein
VTDRPPRSRPWRRRLLLGGAAVAVVAPVVFWAVRGPVGPWVTHDPDTSDFIPDLSGPDRLVSNEWAHFNPGVRTARRSPDWDVTSGSLYVRGGVGWSGPPDAATPDAGSSDGTGSRVFRATSRRRNFGDVQVRLRLRTVRLLDRDGGDPAEPTDGVHLFLRHQSPAHLYAVSLNRRDRQVVVKKKLPGGRENGGTYVTLGQAAHRFTLGRWQSFGVRIVSVGRSVTLTVTLGSDPPGDGHEHVVLEVVDDGRQGAPIHLPGAVGLRGDNCEFEFSDFRASPRR